MTNPLRMTFYPAVLRSADGDRVVIAEVGTRGISMLTPWKETIAAVWYVDVQTVEMLDDALMIKTVDRTHKLMGPHISELRKAVMAGKTKSSSVDPPLYRIEAIALLAIEVPAQLTVATDLIQVQLRGKKSSIKANQIVGCTEERGGAICIHLMGVETKELRIRITDVLDRALICYFCHRQGGVCVPPEQQAAGIEMPIELVRQAERVIVRYNATYGKQAVAQK